MPIYDDLDDQGSKLAFVERCRRDFKATENPLFVWEAWWMVRFTWRSELHESIPLPEWLAEYFDACGKRFLGWQPERVELAPHHWGHLPEENPPRRGEGPGSIGRALGFSEGLALAREHWGGQFDERERRALRVVNLMWDEGRSLDGAAQNLEFTQDPSDGMSWPERRSIRRYVEGSNRSALRRMKDRLREATGTVPEHGEVVNAYSDLCRRGNLTKEPG